MSKVFQSERRCVMKSEDPLGWARKNRCATGCPIVDKGRLHKSGYEASSVIVKMVSRYYRSCEFFKRVAEGSNSLRLDHDYYRRRVRTRPLSALCWHVGCYGVLPHGLSYEQNGIRRALRFFMSYIILLPRGACFRC